MQAPDSIHITGRTDGGDTSLALRTLESDRRAHRAAAPQEEVPPKVNLRVTVAGK